MSNDHSEFRSWQAFRYFSTSVRRNRRYVRSDSDEAFLRVVRATVRDRDVSLEEGRLLYRAQRGIDWVDVLDRWGDLETQEPTGFGSERMKPRPFMGPQGRPNAAGVPVLYLGTTVENVIGEVRPWIGAPVSVAQFRLARSLRAVDLSKGHAKSFLQEVGLWRFAEMKPFTAAEKAHAVWLDIEAEFSRPVTASDDTADYVPTQILTDLFRDLGYDALIYRSRFGIEGLNVALFDVDAADPISCAPFEISGIKMEFRRTAEGWSAASMDPDGEAPGV